MGIPYSWKVTTLITRWRIICGVVRNDIRRNWLFRWRELGAKQVGIIQSLLVTCKLHGINPYTWLVDVLQRIDRHPASETLALMTPKQRFVYANEVAHE